LTSPIEKVKFSIDYSPPGNTIKIQKLRFRDLKAKMKKTLDKRSHPRYRCLVPVQGKQGGDFDQTKTVDIGSHGMGLISPQLISVDQKIPVELILNSQSDSVLVLGQVKWVRRLSGSRRYRIGMSFADVFTGSAFRLGQYFSR